MTQRWTPLRWKRKRRPSRALTSRRARLFETLEHRLMLFNPSFDPGVSVGDFSLQESQGLATFDITLSQPATATATVDWTTSSGTATEGLDYVGASGTVTFYLGELQKQVTVAVHDDAIQEADEIFHVNLSNAVGASIVDGQGEGTIVDDDGDAPHANTFVVDLHTDNTDPNDGLTTLREAVDLANAAPGLDEIVFDLGQQDVIELSAGTPLNITGDLAIVGNESDRITVARSPLSPASRIVEVASGATVTISDLEIRDGDVLLGDGAGSTTKAI